MEDIRKLVVEVLDDSYLLTLAVFDKEGAWSAPVVFIADAGLNLYWISLPETRHSRAIVKNPKIGGTIVASWKDTEERAVQISGIAERIDGIPFDLERKFAEKRNEPIPEHAGDILTFGGEKHTWYKLAPKVYKLTYNKHFGYENKYLEL